MHLFTIFRAVCVNEQPETTGLKLCYIFMFYVFCQKSEI